MPSETPISNPPPELLHEDQGIPLTLGLPLPEATLPIRLLCVDDQPIIAEALKRLLTDLNECTLEYCQDATQAVAHALAFKPSLILQDLVMPHIDGLALLRRFREHPQLAEIPVIVLSTKEDPIVKAQAFALGASDYMVKFPSKLELAARLRYHTQAYWTTLQRNAAYQALREQLNQAARYVESLLPQPSEQPIHSQWAFLPSEKLGGDVFDYHFLDPDHLLIYLLDVCDHGIGPALLSISIFNLLRTHALLSADFKEPASVLSALNHYFPESQHNGNFFTLWYGVYHLPTRTLRYANGGHPPALLLSPDKDTPPQPLGPTGPTVGIFPEAVFSTRSCWIPPGSRLYVFSDGVYEVPLPGFPPRCWTFPEFTHALGQMWAQQGTLSPGRSLVPQLVAYIQHVQEKAEFDDDFSLIELGL